MGRKGSFSQGSRALGSPGGERMKGREAPEWFLSAHVTLGKHRSAVLLSGSLISKAMGQKMFIL